MKLSVLCTAYNEASFLDYSIRSYLDYVDNICIVEGAYKEVIALGKSPRSTDGTIEIIESHRNNPKVHIIYANEQSDKDQRNVGLEKIKELNPDGFLLIVDGDEVWTETSLIQVKALCKLYNLRNIKGVYFQSMTFVNDKDHYCLQDFPRLFKITPDATFFNDNFLNWRSLGWSSPHVIKNLNIKYHHYSFLKGDKKFEEKRAWWNNRGLGPNFDYGWNIDKNGKITDPNHKIYEYTGKHPEIMKDHPIFKEKENDKT